MSWLLISSENNLAGAVFLIVLAGVDAAYSGDWSRVGVISKETEDSLKPLVIGLAAFHIGCAVVAARIASSKGLSVIPRVLKVRSASLLCFHMSLIGVMARLVIHLIGSNHGLEITRCLIYQRQYSIISGRSLIKICQMSISP